MCVGGFSRVVGSARVIALLVCVGDIAWVGDGCRGEGERAGGDSHVISIVCG